jgi:hypothetical protein
MHAPQRLVRIDIISPCWTSASLPLTIGDSFTAHNGNVIAWQDADTVTVNGSSYAITAVKPDADFICLPDHRPP